MAVPIRATNLKAKAVRERSYTKAQAAKKVTVLSQGEREAVNRKRGYTGKQLDSAIRKYATARGYSYRWFVNNLNEKGREAVALEMGLC